MDTVAISVFKARCLSILAEVKRSGRPVLVTRFGEPVAEVVPPPPPARRREWLGSLAGSVRIDGDVVAPAKPARDWEALRR
ncbi:MAG: type II toxin-antitoxin system Phd/YefM family antitoxin [Acidobacteria bacterium]|nr:MAG: type II toxin-antitoxin system Phd/YefM family antitoxin [Acidobacteriota bacterium]MCE7960282.1 type II toxin-antitoxin system Phd/YefM family antitoxin [Acidobacteria bacterium ACB2]